MMINIGFGNIISSDRVVAMVVPESAPSNVSYRRQKKGRWSPNQYRHPDRQPARDSVGDPARDDRQPLRSKRGRINRRYIGRIL